MHREQHKGQKGLNSEPATPSFNRLSPSMRLESRSLTRIWRNKPPNQVIENGDEQKNHKGKQNPLGLLALPRTRDSPVARLGLVGLSQMVQEFGDWFLLWSACSSSQAEFAPC
ncbi:MAG TPA: hypothetical protein VFN35_16690 [Ktedonobacteraceae bacterium]|nr:hypothetical protein [Ktedonobacteraceae bacterium]